MFQNEIDTIELELFLDGLKRRFGYDFTNYARGSISRRVHELKNALNIKHTSELIVRMFHDDAFLTQAMEYLSVQFSEMFRDPHFYEVIREKVVPVLKTYPEVNIWVAGCANGEEAYSLAILLKEEGLFERANIYATDISGSALEKASEGVYPKKELPLYKKNYKRAGGKNKFTDYCVTKYNLLAMDPSLKEIIFFSEHNLTVDGVFCEMHLIMCRNVLIYFNDKLQKQCLNLFDESLIREGFIGLGEKESMDLFDLKNKFNRLSDDTPVFRRKTIPINSD